MGLDVRVDVPALARQEVRKISSPSWATTMNAARLFRSCFLGRIQQLLGCFRTDAAQSKYEWLTFFVPYLNEEQISPHIGKVEGSEDTRSKDE